MKFYQPRVPYSSQILCTQQNTQQKTELAILYYISTSNSTFRRVNKKDIENIDISSMIEVLKVPQRPLSLRVYSFLIKGIVKVYILKVKYCEHEVQGILNGLEVKKLKKKREPSVPRRDSLILKIEDDFIEGYSEPEECQTISNISGPVIVESLTNDNSYLESEVQNEVSEVMDAVVVKKRRKSVVDRRIEIVQNKSVNALKAGDIPKQYCSPLVFKEFENFLKLTKFRGTPLNTDINEIEFHFPDTIGTASPISNSLSVKSAKNTYTKDVHEYEPVKDNLIDKLFSEQDRFNFNKKFLSHPKKDKARIFYRLLELGKLGRLGVSQRRPYEDISVEMVQPYECLALAK